ncbi:hypothetical protein Lesp02_02230 [Lentzea sp. NBRC 105346]|nr:hypothetical protein Lesp02_02230 [Lentzea sp. NBRC 105346]
MCIAIQAAPIATSAATQAATSPLSTYVFLSHEVGENVVPGGYLDVRARARDYYCANGESTP